MVDGVVPSSGAVDGTVRVLRGLRSAGLPFLRGADDATLRAFAVGLRTAVQRRRAGPVRISSDLGGRGERATALESDDRVRLLSDNRESFAHKCALVAGAERTVDVALYYLADDGSGARFAGVLEDATARGVRVRLALDRLATDEKHFGHASPGAQGALALVRRLRDHGVEVTLAGDATWCMHRKFLVVDGRAAVIGGRNVADHYTEQGWRDLELAFSGPFVARLRGAVEDTFARGGAGHRAAPQLSQPGVVLGARGVGGRAFARALENLVANARSHVDIEHAYVLSHRWLEDAVAAAVRRGVSVRVVTNSVATNDIPVMGWRATQAVLALLARGARVFLRVPPATTLHTKLAVADGRFALLGSSNLDYYTPVFCTELDLFFDDSTLAGALGTHVREGLAEPTTREVAAGGQLHRELARRVRQPSVSRLFDALFRDLQ